MIYQWGEGATAQLRAIPADVVGAEMERIRRKAKVTTVAIVEAARPETSRLHKLFEWDNDRAAELYRRGQAREILGHLMVVVDDDEKRESRLVRAAIALRDDPRPAHAERRISVAARRAPAGEPAEAPVTAEHAWEVLMEWRERFGHLREFAMVVKAIDISRRSVA